VREESRGGAGLSVLCLLHAAAIGCEIHIVVEDRSTIGEAGSTTREAGSPTGEDGSATGEVEGA
jgi:hypothetical protein